MRTVLFFNNWGGWHLTQWLRGRDEEIVGLVVHPAADQRFATEIIDAARVPSSHIWTATELRKPETIQAIRRLEPQIGVSGWFGYVLTPSLLEAFSEGCVNLHAAYLPWNRGWNTNVWPILDGSPAGVTLHYVDEGIDSGDLIAQRRVDVRPVDTGGTLHRRLTLETIALFKDTWPRLVDRTNARVPQDHARATKHNRGDLETLDAIDRDARYRVRDLLNLLRARTYPPYPSAYYVARRMRHYVRVNLAEATASPEGVRIELDGCCTGKKLIDVLRGARTRGEWPAYFVDGGCSVQVRASIVEKSAVDPGGYPEWLNSAVTDVSADASALV